MVRYDIVNQTLVIPGLELLVVLGMKDVLAAFFNFLYYNFASIGLVLVLISPMILHLNFVASIFTCLFLLSEPSFGVSYFSRLLVSQMYKISH